MSARLTSRMLVSALIRRVEAAGGTGAVLGTGDATAGAILLICAEKGRNQRLLERVADLDGGSRWARCGPDDVENTEKLEEYLDRRKRNDPDLWVLELTIADAERFAAETIASR